MPGQGIDGDRQVESVRQHQNPDGNGDRRPEPLRPKKNGLKPRVKIGAGKRCCAIRWMRSCFFFRAPDHCVVFYPKRLRKKDRVDSITTKYTSLGDGMVREKSPEM